MSRASSPARRLEEAVWKKDATKVQEAVANGADPDTRSDIGYPLLAIAARNGWTSGMELLLALGANVNADRNGYTALHAAALDNNAVMVEILLKAGSDVDATTNSDGWTSLHNAANCDAAAVVEVLLRHNANQHATNIDGKTPLQVAKRLGKSKAIEAFENFTASQATMSSATAVQRESTDDGWKTREIAVTTTAGSPQPVTSFTEENIGKKGGKFRSAGVSVIVPEDALSTSTALSIDTYLDHAVMPALSAKEEVLLSPVVHLSSSHTRQFNKPVSLSMPPEVSMKSRNRDSGWLLELKESASSSQGAPQKWQTALQLDTNTGEVVPHSPSVRYDPHTGKLYVRRPSFFVWLGKKLGSRSLRKIRYALFGKQVATRKWNIAAHIIHGSKSIYDKIVDNLKARSYTELGVPTRDNIGLHGEVWLKIHCLDPWQIRQGKPEARIATSRIWDSQLNDACYYEFTLEDCNKHATSLECTVDASFRLDSQTESGPERTISMVICQSLNIPQGAAAVAPETMKTVDQAEVEAKKFARKVRKAADRLGGFWNGWSDIPVHVLEDVSELVGSSGKVRNLVNNLPGNLTGKQPDQSKEGVLAILKMWINQQGDRASLPSLFLAMHWIRSFHELRGKIERRIESEEPKEIGIRRFDPDEVCRVVQDNGEHHWYALGLKMGFTSSQVVSTTHDKSTADDKLLALFERKCEDVEDRHRAAARLVAACKNIHSPVIGDVERDLPGVSASVNNE